MSSGRPRDADVDLRIVGATRQLLEEGGMAAVSVSAVAERALVGRPTVYRRYANTEELAMAVLHQDLAHTWIQLRGAAPLPDDVEDYLMAIASHFFRYYAKNRHVARALLQQSLFAPPPWDERFAQQAGEFLAWVTEGLLERQAAGALTADANCVVLTQAFYGLYLTVAIGGTSRLLDSVERQQDMLRGVLRQHLVGLCGEG